MNRKEADRLGKWLSGSLQLTSRLAQLLVKFFDLYDTKDPAAIEFSVGGGLLSCRHDFPESFSIQTPPWTTHLRNFLVGDIFIDYAIKTHQVKRILTISLISLRVVSWDNRARITDEDARKAGL